MNGRVAQFQLASITQDLAHPHSAASAEKATEMFSKATSAENTSTFIIVSSTTTTAAETTVNVVRFTASAAGGSG